MDWGEGVRKIARQSKLKRNSRKIANSWAEKKLKENKGARDIWLVALIEKFSGYLG